MDSIINNIGTIIFSIIVLAAIVWPINIYNTLVRYRTEYKNGFQQISVQLKRRLDLIGNLVEVAKKYMDHENETLLAVTQARQNMRQATADADSNPGDHTTMMNLAASQAGLDKALGGFSLTMEAYPDLKANQNMSELSEELISTENRISSARQGYNDLVQKFNEYKRLFPNVLIASPLGFAEDADVLQYEESVSELNQAPKVSF